MHKLLIGIELANIGCAKAHITHLKPIIYTKTLLFMQI